MRCIVFVGPAWGPVRPGVSVKSQESPWGAAGRAAFVELILGFCPDLWGRSGSGYMLSLRREVVVLDVGILRNVTAFWGDSAFLCVYWTCVVVCSGEGGVKPRGRTDRWMDG